MSNSTVIPASFASSWSQFVEAWCLGTTPAAGEHACGRALNALLKYWPERAESLIAGPTRGLGVVMNAIDSGLVLADTANLAGVEAVVSRLRGGERSALAEITVAAVLTRAGLTVAFGIPKGTKVPDLAIITEPTTTFVEVVAPDRAEIVKEFTDKIGEVASSVLTKNAGANVELFLEREPSTLDVAALTKTITEASFSDDVQGISSVGRFLKRPFSFPPTVSPSIPNPMPGTVLGVARAVIDGSIGGLVAVRGSVFDGRAKRLLAAELHHFARTSPNILVIDTGNVHGGFQDWGPSIMRCFQPTQNTRVSAAVLYQTGILGNPLDVHRAWKVMINPHAGTALPEPVSRALLRLPNAWPTV